MKFLFWLCAFILVASTVAAAPEGPADRETLTEPRLVVLEARAENGDSEARMELARLLLRGSDADRNVERAAYWLRRVAIELDPKYALDAMTMLVELRNEVLQEYPGVEVYDPNGLGGSVGVALWPADHALGVEVMVREAWLFNAAALSGLSTVQRMSAGGSVEPDERIIEFFKQSAAEGLSLSMYEYGRFLLFGWSVEQDIERGTELLKKSDRPEAWLDLANHARHYLGDDALSKEYLTKVAEYDLPEATYELGVFAQSQGDYENAIALFEQTLRLDSNRDP